MKTIQVAFIVLTVIFSSCSDSKKGVSVKVNSQASELDGVWKLTYAYGVYLDEKTEDSATEDSIEEDSSIYGVEKILLNGRFAIGYYNSDSSLFAGGGTFDYDGQTYTENVKYSTNDVVGQAVKFDMTLEKGIWSLKGVVLVDEGGKTREFELEEVWERVE